MAKITDVKGIGEFSATTLARCGIRTLGNLAEINKAKLITVPGFNDIRASRVIAEAKKLLEQDRSAASPLRSKGRASPSRAKLKIVSSSADGKESGKAKKEKNKKKEASKKTSKKAKAVKNKAKEKKSGKSKDKKSKKSKKSKSR